MENKNGNFENMLLAIPRIGQLVWLGRMCKEKKHTKVLIQLGSKHKKHLRGSTQATIHPLALY